MGTSLNRRRSRRATSSVAALAVALIASNAHAQADQDTGPEDPVGATAAPVSNDIVVTGFRKSYADAIAAKRHDIEITDGISSDDLGRIPDLNIGEALQRVPGVQLNREAEGREATINLRGLPGEYARITLNGVAFAEPILQGSTPLGAFLSDIFSGVRIEKSPMAAAQTGGLSGNIDLQIAPALDRKDGGRMKVSYDYNDLGGRAEPSFTLGYNKHITDNFAVFGVASYKHENFRRDSILFNSYGVLSAKITPDFLSRYGDYYAPSGTCATQYADTVGCVEAAGATGTKGQTGVQYVSSNRQYTRINIGNQVSAAGGLEWAPNNELKLGLTGLYTNRRQSGTYQNLQILGFNGNGVVIDPTSDVQTGAHGDHYVTDFDFTYPQAISDSRAFPQTQRAWGINGNVDIKNDKWRFSSVFTVSRAENDSVENFAQFIRGAGVGNGISGSFASGAGNYDDYTLSVSPVPLSTGAPKNSWTWAGPKDSQSWYDSPAGTPGRNRFNFGGTQGYATSQIKAAQEDIERFFPDGFLTSIQVGFRAEENTFTSRGYRTNAAGIQGQNIGDDFLQAAPDADDFFDGHGGGYSTNWLATDLPYVFDQLRPVTPYNGAPLSPSGWNITYSDNNYALYNFVNKTNLIETYAEAKFKSSLFSIPIRGIAGLRYEHADNMVSALDRVHAVSNGLGSPDDYAVRHFDHKYGHLLPSAIVVFDISDKLLARVTGYKTYVRPHPRQFTPVTLVGAASTENVIPVTLGNPDLHPYTGTSFDVSLEWYNRPGGLFAIDMFTKRFKGVVEQVKGAQNLCPADATDLGLGMLHVEGDTCYSSLPPDALGQPTVVNMTGYINSETPYTVNGIELIAQQNLDFLPGFLKYLGGSFNYAYTEIDGKNPDGSKASLPGISKHNINLIGYYETKLFGIRLAYNFRTKYDLASTSTFSGDARQVRPRGQLDLSASLNVREGVSVSVNAFNLTNSIRYEYQGVEEMARRADYDGRTYRLSLNAVF